MTKQEVFDRVIDQLIKQGGPSIDTDIGKCVYHRSDGRMCPGGVFIPKNMISSSYENTPFNYLTGRLKPNKVELPGKEEIALIKELQDAHDESARHDLENARKAFIAVGREHNLSTRGVISLKKWKM